MTKVADIIIAVLYSIIMVLGTGLWVLYALDPVYVTSAAKGLWVSVSYFWGV